MIRSKPNSAAKAALALSDVDPEAAETRARLLRWGTLHHVRSGAGLVGYVLALAAL